jgi:hypothetical protein
MVRFYALLSFATAFFSVSFARRQVVESRELLPIPSLSVISFTGIDAFITVCVFPKPRSSLLPLLTTSFRSTHLLPIQSRQFSCYVVF